MKKRIITTAACIAVAFGIVGCAHTSGAPAEEKQQVATITIASDGTLSVAGQQCPPNELTARLSGVRKAVIRADPQAPYPEILQVLSACKTAGVEQVSMTKNK